MPRACTPKGVVLVLGIGVAVGSCAPAAAPPERVDPVVISPQYYAVLLDSNHVRVLEYRLPPGRREAMHRHPAYVIYFFQAAKLRATYLDGHSSETVVTPGETLYRDALSHAVENIGETDVHALLIELKPGSR
jgi:beta-alanine degradation protein BauB